MELLTNHYTFVKEQIDEKTIGHRIRYGKVESTIKRRDCNLKLISPNQLVVMQRWFGGIFGTQRWTLYIFKTSISSRTKLPNVYPRVDLLLHCRGATRVKRTLRVINQLRELEVDLNDLPESFWIRQNSRLQCSKPLFLPKICKNAYR